MMKRSVVAAAVLLSLATTSALAAYQYTPQIPNPQGNAGMMPGVPMQTVQQQPAQRALVVRAHQDVLQVKLPANATTGFQWYLSHYDHSLLKLQDYYYIAPQTKRVGAPGIAVFVFTVRPAFRLAPQITHIQFVYGRAWSMNTAEPEEVTVVSTGTDSGTAYSPNMGDNQIPNYDENNLPPPPMPSAYLGSGSSTAMGDNAQSVSNIPDPNANDSNSAWMDAVNNMGGSSQAPAQPQSAYAMTTQTVPDTIDQTTSSYDHQPMAYDRRSNMYGQQSDSSEQYAARPAQQYAEPPQYTEENNPYTSAQYSAQYNQQAMQAQQNQPYVQPADTQYHPIPPVPTPAQMDQYQQHMRYQREIHRQLSSPEQAPGYQSMPAPTAQQAMPQYQQAPQYQQMPQYSVQPSTADAYSSQSMPMPQIQPAQYPQQQMGYQHEMHRQVNMPAQSSYQSMPSAQQAMPQYQQMPQYSAPPPAAATYPSQSMPASQSYDQSQPQNPVPVTSIYSSPMPSDNEPMPMGPYPGTNTMPATAVQPTQSMPADQSTASIMHTSPNEHVITSSSYAVPIGPAVATPAQGHHTWVASPQMSNGYNATPATMQSSAPPPVTPIHPSMMNQPQPMPTPDHPAHYQYAVPAATEVRSLRTSPYDNTNYTNVTPTPQPAYPPTSNTQPQKSTSNSNRTDASQPSWLTLPSS